MPGHADPLYRGEPCRAGEALRHGLCHAARLLALPDGGRVRRHGGRLGVDARGGLRGAARSGGPGGASYRRPHGGRGLPRVEGGRDSHPAAQCPGGAPVPGDREALQPALLQRAGPDARRLGQLLPVLRVHVRGRGARPRPDPRHVADGAEGLDGEGLGVRHEGGRGLGGPLRHPLRQRLRERGADSAPLDIPHETREHAPPHSGRGGNSVPVARHPPPNPVPGAQEGVGRGRVLPRGGDGAGLLLAGSGLWGPVPRGDARPLGEPDLHRRPSPAPLCDAPWKRPGPPRVPGGVRGRGGRGSPVLGLPRPAELHQQHGVVRAPGGVRPEPCGALRGGVHAGADGGARARRQGVPRACPGGGAYRHHRARGADRVHPDAAPGVLRILREVLSWRRAGVSSRPLEEERAGTGTRGLRGRRLNVVRIESMKPRSQILGKLAGVACGKGVRLGC